MERRGIYLRSGGIPQEWSIWTIWQAICSHSPREALAIFPIASTNLSRWEGFLVYIDSDDLLPLACKIDLCRHIGGTSMISISKIDAAIEIFLISNAKLTINKILQSNRDLWLSSISPSGFLGKELPGLMSDSFQNLTG